jgi:methylisocitrate lyase
MPYVIASDLPEPRRGALPCAARRPQILQMPGAHLGIAALLAKKQGFEALYMSGAAMSATMGCPTSA